MPTVTHIIDQNLPVYATGNQTISGLKIFGTNNISDTNLKTSPILGGRDNIITGTLNYTFIVNGTNNIITGSVGDSFISNGNYNKIESAGDPKRVCRSYISNGFQNLISNGSCYAMIKNGALNTIQESQYSSILQGNSNVLGSESDGSNDTYPKACLSTIINGSNNKTVGYFNLIGGGSFNIISGQVITTSCCEVTAPRSNVIVGGANNSILNASCSAILGGRYNEISHPGATIIGDGSLNVKTSKGACTLLLSFSNGIYLEAPLTNFNHRPTVNGTGVLLSGEAEVPGALNFVNSILLRRFSVFLPQGNFGTVTLNFGGDPYPTPPRIQTTILTWTGSPFLYVSNLRQVTTTGVSFFVRQINVVGDTIPDASGINIEFLVMP